jgi:phosphate transport system substrate-binding protein
MLKPQKWLKLFLIAVFLVGSVVFNAKLSQAEGSINGAGSTFAYPVYTKWAFEY